MEYLEECIKIANKSLKSGDIPVGAIVVKNNKIIAKGHNMREKQTDIISHAEINAIRSAAKKLKTWNLSECVLYVTLRPCSMCEEVIKQSRIKKVFYLVDKLPFKKEYDKITIVKKENTELEKHYKRCLEQAFKEIRKRNK